MTSTEQKAAAQKFADYWKECEGAEKKESQPFWITLLRNVFGIDEPEKFIQFENDVKLKHTSSIDAYIPATSVLIEQKSKNIDLNKAYKQSDGVELTPYQQAKRYADELDYSQNPRWIVVCNFREFHVHDMEHKHQAPVIIRLEDLAKEYQRLEFLVDSRREDLKREMEVSIQAGEIVGRLYDEILKHYKDPSADSTLKSLNMLCVRLVFCLYAEDAGIFDKKNQFHDYLAKYDAQDLREALIKLFKVLDTNPEERDSYLPDDLLAFPYVNGGLFTDESIEIPLFDDTVKDLLLAKASDDFDWSDISPTIFGALFESTLNPETRRSGGMHYTSIENIHKVIDPLFLDGLKAELEDAKSCKILKTRNNRLKEFQRKLGTLTFLDPACGSGNFLTETYLSLRRMENEALTLLQGKQGELDLGDVIAVSIEQFYGIEINDFAVAVAKTALWIAESQMMKETEAIVHKNLDFLPLKSYANIVEANALQIDWNDVVPKEKLSYIMGNPPFIGARKMNSEQKKDLLKIFHNTKNAGNLDYVSCWYKLVSEMIQNTKIRAALVSTNSITQGEQPAILWKTLFDKKIRINFAYRTFRWDSEARIRAHVHCVIIGFSQLNEKRWIFKEDGAKVQAENISPYLIDAPNIMLESRRLPIYDVPEIGMGNQPIDNGIYLFTTEEKDKFVKKEPASSKYFKDWYGSDEFINGKPRQCLWLGKCSPANLKKMPLCLKRVQAVKKYRLSSKRSSTVNLANKPTRFQTENMPNGHYIVIPEVSSEKRLYIPIGYMNENVLCSNKLRLMPNATLLHLGILTSSIHMAWVRVVCGRLKSDYDYSVKIVYNNFPWPECIFEIDKKSVKICQQISTTAQGILDARALYPDCSLAFLYDETTMPDQLYNAHEANDRAVMKAYGFTKDMSELEIVSELMNRYQRLVEEKANETH